MGRRGEPDEGVARRARLIPAGSTAPRPERSHRRTALADDALKAPDGAAQPLPGYHDVVVHGNNQGFFEPWRVNEAGSSFSAGDTHPTHIADAIRANPSYDGGPVRLVSCHTGTTAEGALDIAAAQAVANELGVPVMAPTNKVGVNTKLGPSQTPKIFGGGYWRTFLPMTRRQRISHTDRRLLPRTLGTLVRNSEGKCAGFPCASPLRRCQADY